MTAHEQQDQRVVGIDLRLAVRRRCNDDRGFVCHDSFTVPARDLAANVIDHSTQRHLDQPAAWIVGDAVARPLCGRGDQRFLHGVLGVGEVAKSPDHRAEHLRREVAQQTLDTKVQRR